MRTDHPLGKRNTVPSKSRTLKALALTIAAALLLTSCGGGGNEGSANGGGNAEKPAGGEAKKPVGGGGNGGGGTGGGGNNMQGAATNAEQPPITDPRIVFATVDKNSINGNRARFRGVEVQEVVGERAFFIGESSAEVLLVVLGGDQNAEQVGVSKGKSINVNGVLRKPNENLQNNLELSEEEASVFNEQDIFLRAGRVTEPKK